MSEEAVISPGLLTAEPTSEVRASVWDFRAGNWNREDFVREQVHGLVRQLFFSKTDCPVHQIVFCAAEVEIDVRDLCWRVGQDLALETEFRVAVVGQCPQEVSDHGNGRCANPAAVSIHDERAAVFPGGIAMDSHLWQIPPPNNSGNHVSAAFVRSYLDAVRGRFEYSIVAGPPAADLDAAAAMAQVADGIVLVVSASRTRRLTARKIKDRLEAAQACVLGVVLSDRAFPIPEWIYRRL